MGTFSYMESLGKMPLNRNPEHAGSHCFESSNSSQALGCDCTLLSTRPNPQGAVQGDQCTESWAQRDVGPASPRPCLVAQTWLGARLASQKQQVFLQDREVTCRPHIRLWATL